MANEPARDSSKTTYQLHVSLPQSDPMIWRRLAIPGETPLVRLHALLQAAIGLSSEHLFSFIINKREYGPLPSMHSLLATLVDLELSTGSKFTYVYDFGSEWKFAIAVENVSSGFAHLHPICLDGAGAAPVEGCLLPEFLDAVKVLLSGSPDQQAESKDILGEDYDPLRFSCDEANALMKEAAGIPLGELPFSADNVVEIHGNGGDLLDDEEEELIPDLPNDEAQPEFDSAFRKALQNVSAEDLERISRVVEKESWYLTSFLAEAEADSDSPAVSEAVVTTVCLGLGPNNQGVIDQDEQPEDELTESPVVAMLRKLIEADVELPEYLCLDNPEDMMAVNQSGIADNCKLEVIPGLRELVMHSQQESLNETEWLRRFAPLPEQDPEVAEYYFLHTRELLEDEPWHDVVDALVARVEPEDSEPFCMCLAVDESEETLLMRFENVEKCEAFLVTVMEDSQNPRDFGQVVMLRYAPHEECAPLLEEVATDMNPEWGDSELLPVVQKAVFPEGPAECIMSDFEEIAVVAAAMNSLREEIFVKASPWPPNPGIPLMITFPTARGKKVHAKCTIVQLGV